MGFVGTKDTVYIDTSCSVYKPILWSKSDTRETQEQIIEHNAVFKALCIKEDK